MHSAWALIAALLEGLLIGFAFFGGLWWTVRKGVMSAHPASLFLGSLVVRTTITVGAFYFISMGGWRPLIICLIGFVIGRMLVVRLTLHWTPASILIADGAGV
jgi:F1F0 ATPase subunit 2